MGELAENQKMIHQFLLHHFKTKETFSKGELAKNAQDWHNSTFDTYFAKIFSPLLVEVDNDKFKVNESFAKFAASAHHFSIKLPVRLLTLIYQWY